MRLAWGVSMSGVSWLRVVRWTAAAEPTWSKKAFSPLMVSTSTALRNRLPICCESIVTFDENWFTNAVVICEDISQSSH